MLKDVEIRKKKTFWKLRRQCRGLRAKQFGLGREIGIPTSSIVMQTTERHKILSRKLSGSIIEMCPHLMSFPRKRRSILGPYLRKIKEGIWERS